MKGIIAGEGCIFHQKESKHRSVYISVTKIEEKEIYFKCLLKLDIKSNKWKDDKLVISKRKNNIELLKQRLMTLSDEKYNKFLNMMKTYPHIKEETNYFFGNHKYQWNKISQEKLNKIIEFYKSGITNTKDIAEKLNISRIKVQKVLKENNLGNRKIKTSEEKRQEIAEFAGKNKNLTQKEIATYFNLHESIIRRAIKKYKGVTT